MIKLFGEYYYIDFEELDDFLLLDKDGDDKITTTKRIETHNSYNSLEGYTVEHKEHIKHKEINGVKFELIRNFISDLGDEEDEADYGLGSNNLQKTSVRFKLAFNTLIVYGILKKMD